MLIISKQHDYYDSVGKMTGIDKTIVFQREEKDYYSHDKEIERFLKTVKEFPRGYRYGRTIPPRSPEHIPTGYAAGALGFCGKTYPMLSVQWRDSSQTVEHYNEDAAATLDIVAKAVDNSTFLHPRGLERKQSWLNFRFTIDDFRHYASPILLLETEYVQDCGPRLTVNPVLKNYGFQRIMDPFTAFQEIQMFISGVLGSPEKETATISDVHRLEAAGFDKKWSFRKPPKH